MTIFDLGSVRRLGRPLTRAMIEEFLEPAQRGLNRSSVPRVHLGQGQDAAEHPVLGTRVIGLGDLGVSWIIRDRFQRPAPSVTGGLDPFQDPGLPLRGRFRCRYPQRQPVRHPEDLHVDAEAVSAPKPVRTHGAGLHRAGSVKLMMPVGIGDQREDLPRGSLDPGGESDDMLTALNLFWGLLWAAGILGRRVR